MALPHPKSRKDHYGKEDKPNSRSVVWNLFKRTVNVTDYRNGNDDVNPANNRTFSGFFHDWVVNLFYGESQCQLLVRANIPHVVVFINCLRDTQSHSRHFSRLACPDEPAITSRGLVAGRS